MVLLSFLSLIADFRVRNMFSVDKPNQLISDSWFYFDFILLQLCVPPLSLLAPVSLRLLPLKTLSALIGQLTHAWLSSADSNRAALLNPLLCAQLAAVHRLCSCVTWWCSVMSQRHGIKGGELLMRRFRSSVFCRREELLLVVWIDLFNFQDLLNAQEPSKKKKSIRFPHLLMKTPVGGHLATVGDCCLHDDLCVDLI